MEFPNIKVIMKGPTPATIIVDGFELPCVSHANIPLNPNEVEHIEVSLIGHIEIVHELAGLKEMPPKVNLVDWSPKDPYTR